MPSIKHGNLLLPPDVRLVVWEHLCRGVWVRRRAGRPRCRCRYHIVSDVEESSDCPILHPKYSVLAILRVSKDIRRECLPVCARMCSFDFRDNNFMREVFINMGRPFWTHIAHVAVREEYALYFYNYLNEPTFPHMKSLTIYGDQVYGMDRTLNQQGVEWEGWFKRIFGDLKPGKIEVRIPGFVLPSDGNELKAGSVLDKPPCWQREERFMSIAFD